MSLCSSLWLCAAQLLVHEHTRLLSASTNPLRVWDPKRRLFLQLIPLRKALVKMNEPPPAWGPAEKAPLPPWKRLHILSVSHHQSCIFGAACSITEHQTHNLQQAALIPRAFPSNPGPLSKTLRNWKWYHRNRQLVCEIHTGLEEKQERGKTGISGVSETTKKKKKMAKPNYSGTYHMVEQENMDSYLGALGTNLYTVF